MKATIESSAPYQNALDRTVPSTYAPQLRNDLTELQMYRAERAERDQQLDDGRKKVSNELESLVLAAIGNTRAKLEADVSTNRRHAIEEHLKTKWEFYGLERLPDGTVKLPNRKLIKRVLKSQGL